MVARQLGARQPRLICERNIAFHDYASTRALLDIVWVVVVLSLLVVIGVLCPGNIQGHITSHWFDMTMLRTHGFESYELNQN